MGRPWTNGENETFVLGLNTIGHRNIDDMIKILDKYREFFSSERTPICLLNRWYYMKRHEMIKVANGKFEFIARKADKDPIVITPGPDAPQTVVPIEIDDDSSSSEPMAVQVPVPIPQPPPPPSAPPCNPESIVENKHSVSVGVSETDLLPPNDTVPDQPTLPDHSDQTNNNNNNKRMRMNEDADEDDDDFLCNLPSQPSHSAVYEKGVQTDMTGNKLISLYRSANFGINMAKTLRNHTQGWFKWKRWAYNFYDMLDLPDGHKNGVEVTKKAHLLVTLTHPDKRTGKAKECVETNELNEIFTLILNTLRGAKKVKYDQFIRREVRINVSNYKPHYVAHGGLNTDIDEMNRFMESQLPYDQYIPRDKYLQNEKQISIQNRDPQNVTDITKPIIVDEITGEIKPQNQLIN